jgi:hypothetical protein
MLPGMADLAKARRYAGEHDRVTALGPVWERRVRVLWERHGRLEAEIGRHARAAYAAGRSPSRPTREDCRLLDAIWRRYIAASGERNACYGLSAVMRPVAERARELLAGEGG